VARAVKLERSNALLLSASAQPSPSSLEVIHVEGFSGLARKHPPVYIRPTVLEHLSASRAEQVQEERPQARGHGHITPLAALGAGDLALDVGSPNMDVALLEIYVLPSLGA